jgi:hypothetical protein
MWVFTRDGFFSVVKKECKADEVMVRARQKSDLLGLGKKLNLTLCIQTDAGTDYAFRAVLKQSDWAGYLADPLCQNSCRVRGVLRSAGCWVHGSCERSELDPWIQHPGTPGG